VNGPILIGGPSRSGKTLVRWILTSHPRIAVSRRTEMWPRFAGRFGDLADPDALDRCLDAMLARPQIAALEPDGERVRLAFGEGAPTYARLFAVIHESYARRVGKARWGDQSPGLERSADEALSAYEDAVFLHVLRDPRDAYAGIVERRGMRRGGAARAGAAWAASAALADAHLARWGAARYAVVRYEDLVTDPSGTVRGICDLLGERLDPAMLGLAEAERYRHEESASEAGPITARYVGVYRTQVPPADLATLQRSAGRWMARFGYEPETLHLSASDRLRRAVEAPMGRARGSAARLIRRSGFAAAGGRR